jgi:hypothetical protein
MKIVSPPDADAAESRFSIRTTGLTVPALHARS